MLVFPDYLVGEKARDREKQRTLWCSPHSLKGPNHFKLRRTAERGQDNLQSPTLFLCISEGYQRAYRGLPEGLQRATRGPTEAYRGLQRAPEALHKN